MNPSPEDRVGYGLPALFTVTLMFLASPALAQETQDRAPDSGGSNFDLGATVTEIYDDNIFATRNDKEGDFITVISPFLAVDALSENYGYAFDLGADTGIHAENDRENFQDYWAGGEARFNPGGTAELFGGARYSHLHEERSSPDDVLGADPTEFDDIETFLGAQLRAGRVTARLGGTWERLDYIDNVPALDPANHDDRDRDIWSAGARVGYRLSNQTQLFVQGANDVRRYDDALDDNLQDRDSEGFNAALGTEFRKGTVTGEVLAGYLHQNYDDPAFDDVGAVDFGARLRWQASPTTVVGGAVDRTLEETTLLDASSYLRTALSAEVSHQVREDLIFSADGILARRDFQGLHRNDDIVEAGIGVVYYFQPRLFVGLDYRFINQNSNTAENDYDENRILLHLGARLKPQFGESGPATGAAEGTAAAPDGLYVGVQGSHHGLVTELAGPRAGGGGTLETDIGDQGFGGGGFVGYGRRFGDWYLGAELSADTASVKYGHANVGVAPDPDGRIFSVERGPSYALEGRLGTTLDDGSLFYGLAGIVDTQFDTDYTHPGGTVNQTDHQLGMRIGTGAEFPLSGHLFGRMDYAYTSYADYDINVGGIDNFAHEEGTLRLGIGYRFGETGRPRDTAPKHDFRGPYAGLQLGFGGLFTDNAGPRTTGSGNKFLTVERGHFGAVGGGFAGIGTTFGRIYLGAELQGELSDQNWNVEREPTGRTYSVEREYSYGGGLRLGYLVNGTTLVYGRAAAVRTGFTTDYSEGANRVVVDDPVNGLQFGGGVEMPASQRTFVRVDYAYTQYDDYTVDYVGGVDSFDNSEATLRIGIGLRY